MNHLNLNNKNKRNTLNKGMIKIINNKKSKKIQESMIKMRMKMNKLKISKKGR